MTPWPSLILALKAYGLREIDIAAYCKCNQSTINYLLNGRLAQPRYPLGVSLHELLAKQGKTRPVKRPRQGINGVDEGAAA